MAWNEEMRTRALTLAANNQSAAQIANALTIEFDQPISRSAVCAIFFRMRNKNLVGDETRLKSRRLRGPAKPKPAAPSQPPCALEPISKPEPVPVAAEPEDDEPIIAEASPDTQPQEGELLAGIPWLERTSFQCTTVLTLGTIEHIRVCGKPIVPERSYCKECCDKHYYIPAKRTKEERELSRKNYEARRRQVSRFRY